MSKPPLFDDVIDIFATKSKKSNCVTNPKGGLKL
jgi:hypothetical protein